MFVHNLNPIAFELFGRPVYYYGIVYAVGFLVAFLFYRYLARHELIQNLKEENVVDLMIIIIISVVIGGRLGHIIFYNLGYYLEHPLQMIMLGKGGMSFHGSLVGLILGYYYFARRHKISFYSLMDYAIVVAPLFLGFGRIANFINAELYGIATSVPWAVKFPGVEGFRHPTQLYESLQSFLIFLVIASIARIRILSSALKHTLSRWKQFLISPGVMSWIFVFLYGSIRFVIEFYKDLEIVYGLRIGQWLSLMMVIAGCIALWILYRRFDATQDE